MKEVYAYIRVSTVRQGEKGSSLGEQHDSIEAYALRHSLHVVTWFEERQTAAKGGRPEFSRMLRLLERRAAAGVILHKIDRGARNLRDWANLRELVERGIDVFFAHESLDLTTRSGSLAADVQAVIAADYVRNLRDEVKKGILGRLKQGLYPWPAPIGYLDRGGGQPKVPDPRRAPLIQKAFELYGSGTYGLNALSDTLYAHGFRNSAEQKIHPNRLSEILHNPFYVGLIRIKGTGQTYPGAHEPLIPVPLFERVQAVLSGKAQGRVNTHAYLFRRMIRCRICGYALIGERQKGYVYYRCHTKTCPSMCFREERVEETIGSTLMNVAFTPEEAAALRELAQTNEAEWQGTREETVRATRFNLDAVRARLSRLLDAYLAGTIDPPIFEEKQRSLLLEQRSLEDRLANVERGASPVAGVFPYLELAESLPLSYEMANPDEKRELVEKLTSNLSATGKNLVVELRSPYKEIANRPRVRCGAPYRGTPRTGMAALKKVLGTLVAYVSGEYESMHDV